MTGKTSTDLSSVLPPDARTARIAAGGGLVASLREPPGRRTEARDGEYIAAGFEPDGLDFIVSPAADLRIASSLSIPRPSVQKCTCFEQ